VDAAANDPGAAPILLSALAGGMVILAVREMVLASPAALRWIQISLAPISRAGREGYEPSDFEVRRLAVLASLAALLGIVTLVGPGPLGLVSIAGPAAITGAIARSRSRYREQVRRELPAIATAVADALAGGRSVRSALIAAPDSLLGSAAIEMSRLRADLELGSPTDVALAELQARIRSSGMDSLVMALGSRQLSGPDIAGLLRRYAGVLAEREQIAAEARSATAQARFTGVLVVAMPMGAGLLAELIRPGFTAALLSDPVASALMIAALALQLGGFVVISRIAGGID
jgi:tight adherence protein B